MTDEEQLWQAFRAGFEASGEGFNGEYPFGDKGMDPTEAVRPIFNVWLKRRTTDPMISVQNDVARRP